MSNIKMIKSLKEILKEIKKDSTKVKFLLVYINDIMIPSIFDLYKRTATAEQKLWCVAMQTKVYMIENLKHKEE